MTLPVLSHTTAQFPGSAADAAVLVVATLPESAESLSAYPGLADALSGIGFTGSADHSPACTSPRSAPCRSRSWEQATKPDAAAVRNAAGAALRSLTGFDHVALGLADGLEGFAPAAAEGAVLGGHRFDGYRSEKGKTRATAVTLHAVLTDEEAAHAQTIGDAVALIKDLVNVPAEWQSPAQLAQSAADSVADLDVNGRDPRREGAGGEGLRRHPGRRTGLRPTAAARSPRLLPRGCESTHRPRRQGHHIRHRGTVPEARGVDGRDEVRHGGSGHVSRGAPRDRRAAAAGARDGVALHHRQHAVRASAPSRRRHPHPRRHDRRGPEHRCRRPPRPRRRPGRGEVASSPM